MNDELQVKIFIEVCEEIRNGNYPKLAALDISTVAEFIGLFVSCQKKRINTQKENAPN